MILLQASLLADENVDERVVLALRLRGSDIESTRERGRHGMDDAIVLAIATDQGRVVLAHDSDFGTLAVHRGEPFVGIVYVRSGDLHPSVVLEVLDVVASSGCEVSSGFIVVVERRGCTTKVRVSERR